MPDDLRIGSLQNEGVDDLLSGNTALSHAGERQSGTGSKQLTAVDWK